MVIVGRYRLLDNFVKVIIVILTVSTVVAVLFGIGKTDYFTSNSFKIDFQWDRDLVHIGFLIAFLGWMPAPMDVSVWYSQWIVAKQREDQNFNSNKAILDFKIGYIGTAILAFFFLALGAFSLYGSGENFSNKATLFVNQLIDLYTGNIGKNLGFVVKIAAFATMFSTTLTCMDAFSRVLNSEHSNSFTTYKTK